MIQYFSLFFVVVDVIGYVCNQMDLKQLLMYKHTVYSVFTYIERYDYYYIVLLDVETLDIFSIFLFRLSCRVFVG